tara:strand:- start:266 stop:544 length:279 start_codon:yes stop_codon:yes gene_type:complete
MDNPNPKQPDFIKYDEEKPIIKLNVSNIEEHEDGTSTIDFEANDEFIAWFKKHEGLKRFSQKRFEKFVHKALNNLLKEEENKEDGTVQTKNS